jgi:uncharacterized protein DUF998
VARAAAPRRLDLVAAAGRGHAIGLLGAGVFVTDPVSGYPPGTPDRLQGYGSVHAALHDLFSVGTFVGLPAACLVFARRFAGRGERGWAIYSAATGLLFMAGFVLATLAFSQTEPLVAFGGLLQRATVTLGLAWPGSPCSPSTCSVSCPNRRPPAGGRVGGPGFVSCWPESLRV